MSLGNSRVDVFSMSNGQDKYQDSLSFHSAHDAVVTHAISEQPGESSGQSFAERLGILRWRNSSAQIIRDPALNRFVQAGQILLRRRVETNRPGQVF